MEGLVVSMVPAVAAAGAWFGPYRVVRMIDRGGMGVVYEAEAEDPAGTRRVALKVLPSLGLPDPRDQERFRREIELAGRLDHPHIVPILDLGTIGGIPYCTMELIEGQDLRTTIRSLCRADPTDRDGQGPYWQFVARVGAQAARAPGPCPLPGDLASRYQAVEPPARRPGERPRHRLRAGQGRREVGPDRDRRPGRYPALPGPRTTRRHVRPVERRLQPGPDPLRVAGATPGVRIVGPQPVDPGDRAGVARGPGPSTGRSPATSS